MTNVLWGNQVATDEIQDGDQILTLDNSSGSDVAKPRTMAQVRTYVGAGDGGQAAAAIDPALLYRSAIGTVGINISAATDIHVDDALRPPAASRGAEIELSIGTIGTGTIGYAAWNALTAINAQSLPVGGLVDANSVSVTIGGIVFRVARATNVSGAANTTDAYFAFGAGANGAYSIALNYLQLALESWADRNSPSAQIPANRLSNAPAGGGGGLNLSQVNAAIDTAIPPAQRVPSFAAGDAGEVVKVNATGTGLIIAPETPGSGGGSNELNVLASLPALANHQVGDIINLSGVLYELVASTEDPNVYRGTIAQVSAGFLGDSLFEYQTVSPFNRRLYIPRTAPGFSTPPATIYTLVQTPSPHGLYSTLAWGRAPADDRGAGDADHPNTYAYHKPSGETTIDALPIGTNFSLSFYADEGLKTALNFHSANRWERDDRNEANVNPIAIAGNEDRWGYPKLPSDVAKAGDIPHVVHTTLYDELFPGLSITRGDTDVRPSAATFPSGTIDLDDNAHGEFHVSLELNITASSDVNLSFHRNTANATAEQRMVNHSANIFASDISEEGAFVFSSTAALAGVTAVTQNIFSANTLVGTYYLLLVHNTDNQVGFYHHYDGMAGSANLTIAAELRVSFSPTDAPASSGGGGGGGTGAALDFFERRASSGAIRWSQKLFGTHANNVHTDTKRGSTIVAETVNLGTNLRGLVFKVTAAGIYRITLIFTPVLYNSVIGEYFIAVSPIKPTGTTDKNTVGQFIQFITKRNASGQSTAQAFPEGAVNMSALSDLQANMYIYAINNNPSHSSNFLSAPSNGSWLLRVERV